MPKSCYVCGKQAVVAAKINDGREIINAFLCAPCLHAAGRLAQVHIVASAIPEYEAGQVIGTVPQDEEPEPDPLDDFEFDSEPEEESLDSEEESEEQLNDESSLQQSESRKSSKLLLLTAILIALVVFSPVWFFVLVLNNNRSKSSSPSYSYSSSSSSSSYSLSSNNFGISGYTNDEIKAGLWALTTQNVKNQLKSSSTAKFPKSYSEADFGRDGDYYTVKSWVDAQNSFGATIRQYFTVYAEWKSDKHDFSFVKVEFEK